MDYRTYRLLNLPLKPGVTVFLGSNGVGKTNIVEALDYTARLGSHRVSQDAPLVRVGAQRAYIRTRTVRGRQETVLEFEIAPGQANRVRINRAAPVRAREALGITRTVFFSPEDLALVKGEPAGRRRFLDDLATSLRPVVASYRANYEKILRQRNSLLKAMRSPRRRTEAEQKTLEIWNQQLAEAGAYLFQARLRTLALLAPELKRAYGQLTDGSKQVQLAYQSRVLPELSEGVLQQAALMSVADLKDILLEAIEARVAEEMERGLSLVGPHRDDLSFLLGGIPVKGFASHGESWTYALALKLAAWYVHLADDSSPGAAPILILDDVFAELDQARRRRLGALVAGAEQVLVTCAVPTDIPQDLGRYELLQVEAGQVTALKSPTGLDRGEPEAQNLGAEEDSTP